MCHANLKALPTINISKSTIAFNSASATLQWKKRERGKSLSAALKVISLRIISLI